MRQSYNSNLVNRARDMRKEPTAAERKLWFEYLRALPLRVRRQCPLDKFIVDFYVHKFSLVIELDGDTHASKEAQAYDLERTQVLEGMGLTVLRFTNRDVFEHFEGVCETLRVLFEGVRDEKS